MQRLETFSSASCGKVDPVFRAEGMRSRNGVGRMLNLRRQGGGRTDEGLEETKLRSFDEAMLGTEIFVFGNVAVALAGCEMAESGADVHGGVEMLLLIKDAGAWQVVSQAWDTENPSAADAHAASRQGGWRVTCIC